VLRRTRGAENCIKYINTFSRLFVRQSCSKKVHIKKNYINKCVILCFPQFSPPSKKHLGSDEKTLKQTAHSFITIENYLLRIATNLHKEMKNSGKC
jgi:hypothetical protein